MNFHVKENLGVEITAYKGEMMKEGSLTSYTSYDAYRFCAARTVTDVTN